MNIFAKRAQIFKTLFANKVSDYDAAFAWAVSGNKTALPGFVNKAFHKKFRCIYTKKQE